LGKKDKNKKEKKKEKKKLLKIKDGAKETKKKCCEKYKKGEHKRCKNCPRFDIIKE
jgi:ferric iron reductase protein FhuF